MTQPAPRSPAWSQWLTGPASRALPLRWRSATLWWIKAVHTFLFVSIGGAIALFAWDGFAGRPRRRTAYALRIALGETAVYLSSNQGCPLTPLAEDLGAESGSVVDIILRDAVARGIPLVSGTALLLGIAMNIRSVLHKPMPMES